LSLGIRKGPDAAFTAGTASAAPYILYAGGLNPRKNVARADLCLCQGEKVLGSGNTAGDSRGAVWPGRAAAYAVQCLGAEEAVVFPGFVPMDDIVTLYQGAELFAYPSLYEGFGLPPLEAMACGIPVITSPVPSVTEVAKGAALLFNPEDTTSLADHLSQGLWDVPLRNTMCQRGLAATDPLSWRQTALETLAVYNEILGTREHIEGQVRLIEN
jgi:glycosyltransferase involved in cell wall biosynthesis